MNPWTIGIVYLLLACGVVLGMLIAGLCASAAAADREELLELTQRDLAAARAAAQRLDAEHRRWQLVREARP